MEGMHYYKTDTYVCHHFETASGIRFVLNTDRDAGDLRPNLRHIYSNIFVEYVVKNPLQKLNDPITCQGFISNLRQYISSLPCFR